MLFRHAKGLQLLFMTEMWERFSFYVVRSLVVLYMTAKLIDGGLGWSKASAISLYGIYMSIAYITPIVGGYLSDRFLGQRRSAMVGAFMMAGGYLLLTVNQIPFFYTALALVALGNGFFKPCLTSILGQLYDDAEESQRDGAYSIFYTGINVGGILAGLASGWLMVNYGFDYGFAAAGIGMGVGLLIFWWGKGRYLGTAGEKPQVKTVDHHAVPLTHEEKSRLWVVGLLILMTIFFFAGWEQMGGIVPLFINESIDRSFLGWQIPVPWLANVDPLFIVVLAPLISIFWAYLGKKDRDPFVGTKMGIAFLFMVAAFLLIGFLSAWIDNGSEILPSWSWILLYKFLIALGEICFVPISWAAATKLSPSSYVSRVMGCMLAGIGIGSYLAGYIGSFVDDIGATAIFYAVTCGMGICGAVCFMANPVMKKMSHGAA